MILKLMIWFTKNFAISKRKLRPPRLDTLEKILTAQPGDPYAGESIFTVRCASCHKLFFKGGEVGPDLTRYQRDELSTMLVSILEPNAEIREGYENVIVTTSDKRVLSGFLSDEGANSIVLRGFDGADITIPRKKLFHLSLLVEALCLRVFLMVWMTLPFEIFSHIFESLNRLRSDEIRGKIWADKLFAGDWK